MRTLTLPADFSGVPQLPTIYRKVEKNENGYRQNTLFQWLTGDIGEPMLKEHMHTIVMFQRLAIANGHGWKRFLHMVDQVLPKKGNTLELPLKFHDDNENDTA